MQTDDPLEGVVTPIIATTESSAFPTSREDLNYLNEA